jgi:RNase P protein component
MGEDAVERLIRRLVSESRRDVHRGDVIAGDLLFEALARILFELREVALEQTVIREALQQLLDRQSSQQPTNDR